MICKGFFVKKTAQPKDSDFENQISADIENQISNMVEKLSRQKAVEEFNDLVCKSACLTLIRSQYSFLKEKEDFFADNDKREQALQTLRNEYNERLEIFLNPAAHIHFKEFLTDEEKLQLFELFTTPIPNLD